MAYDANYEYLDRNLETGFYFLLEIILFKNEILW